MKKALAASLMVVGLIALAASVALKSFWVLGIGLACLAFAVTNGAHHATKLIPEGECTLKSCRHC